MAVTYRSASAVLAQANPTVPWGRTVGGLCGGRSVLASHRISVVQVMPCLFTLRGLSSRR